MKMITQTNVETWNHDSMERRFNGVERKSLQLSHFDWAETKIGQVQLRCSEPTRVERSWDEKKEMKGKSKNGAKIWDKSSEVPDRWWGRPRGSPGFYLYWFHLLSLDMGEISRIQRIFETLAIGEVKQNPIPSNKICMLDWCVGFLVALDVNQQLFKTTQNATNGLDTLNVTIYVTVSNSF